ncbi:substrate-binding domain-containing protein [Kitasatospora sp. NPDC058115]|uniref:substrate-binding domain-containing protein n=1 Tax=Kitasatospora sp. NPDC058115 TaxID=3346347 RepID=UPI0036DBDD01
MLIRLTARAVPALAAACALALTATATAGADPVTLPAATDVVGVGAGVTETLFTQFSTDYNAALAAAGDTTSPRLHSWDTGGTAQITPKAGASPIARPDRTGAALAALNTTTSGTVDFVRTSRVPNTTDLPGNLFVAMAWDAVSWAAPAGGNAPQNLTTSDLSNIYNCRVTKWKQINPALPDATIVPVLAGHLSVDRSGVTGTPMESSDFFLKAIKYPPAGTDGPSDRSCVRVVARGDQGWDPILHDPNAIVPYSVGRFVGQVYGGHSGPGDDPVVLTVRDIDGIAAVDPVARQMALGFSSSSYGRWLFNVVREADWTRLPATNTLRNVFGTYGWICRSPVAAAAIKSYGFRVLPVGACGSTRHA